MKQILVPIDFSNTAINALYYAQKLFQKQSCIFYIFHVYISTSSNLLSEDYSNEVLEELSKEYATELSDLLIKTRRDNKNKKHSFEKVMTYNTLEDSISVFVTSKKIDYIVMGTKGARVAIDVFLGSNTIKVINSDVSCPVIVVPESYQAMLPTKLVFSTNFKKEFFKKELEPLINILKTNNLKIFVVQIMIEEYLNETQRSNKEQLFRLLNGFDCISQKINVETSETNAVKDFITTTQTDMLTLIHHNHNFFYRLLKQDEDVIKKMTFNSPVPILILQEK